MPGMMLRNLAVGCHPIYLRIAMSERFEQYKAQALEWERLAAEAQSPMARSCYQSLAQQWRELAKQADQFESQRGQD
jgi:hypothetical protein